MFPDNDFRNPIQMPRRTKGRYRIRKFKGGILLKEANVDNVVVNGTYNQLMTGTSGSANMVKIKGVIFGSGTNLPLPTDTALQSYLGGGNSFQGTDYVINSTIAPRYVEYAITVRCAEGAVVGNVAELAMYRAAGNSALAPSAAVAIFSRARITDELGNPTVISVASDEFLEVTFYWRIYMLDGVTGTLTINLLGTPTNFDYEIRPVCMENIAYLVKNIQSGSNNYTASFSPFVICGTASNPENSSCSALSAFEDPSSGGNASDGSVVANKFTHQALSTYVTDSFTRTQTIRLGLSNGNIASPGIRSFILVTGGLSQSDGTRLGAHRMVLDGPFEKMVGQLFDLPIVHTIGNT